MMDRKRCDGTGQHGVPSAVAAIYPACPVCGREFSATGPKAQQRLGNPWKSIPAHLSGYERSR